LLLLLLQIVDETLPALLELKQQGVIRAIGITGYPLDIFRYILDK
jgi:L-galactose dehydrogenase